MYGTIIHLVNESSRLECELKPRGTAENIQSQQRKLSEHHLTAFIPVLQLISLQTAPHKRQTEAEADVRYISLHSETHLIM